MAGSSGDWLEPPAWWKRWRPLRWALLLAIVVGVGLILRPALKAEREATTPVADAEQAPKPAPAEEAVETSAALSEATPADPVPEAPPVADPPIIAVEPDSPAQADDAVAAYTRVAPDPVALIDGLSSYMSVETVVEMLEQQDYIATVESIHHDVPADVPPNNFDILTVRDFRHWGVDGRLELQFFNDRLYQTEFEPVDIETYLVQQQAHLPQLQAERSGRAEWIDGHLRMASSLELAVSEVGVKLRSRPFLLMQDLRLIRQRDEWDQRYAQAAAE